jgi:heme-degrading monooxygenase HmoA
MTAHEAPAAVPAAGFAPRLAPPYYAVVFCSQRTGPDAGYAQAAAQMVELAALQPGYLGMESAREGDGLGLTVSYWRSLEDISAWRRHAEHSLIREQGRAGWYSHYELRIARVERAYGWDAADGPAAPVVSPV